MSKLEEHKDIPGVESTLHAINVAGMLIEDLSSGKCDAFEQKVHAAFRKALEQPKYQEAVEFFQGFAKGLAKPGFKDGKLQQQTDATVIYQKMWLHREEVDRLSSVTELYEFLVAQGFNRAALGDIDRLRRLCNRIGYAPGKRGRPRKLEK